MTEPAVLSDRDRELQAEAMEAQHEVLMSLMRAVAERGGQGAPKSEISQLLRQLESQTAHHFQEEEQYMRDLAHPKLDTHQIIHRDLLSMLRRHVDEFESSEGRVAPKLLGFLKYWLAAHFDGMDRHLAQFSRSLRRPSSGLRKLTSAPAGACDAASQAPGGPKQSLPADAGAAPRAAARSGRR
jgi:hemerythrin-like metal-binding protein